MPESVRRVVARFWAFIDSENVRLFVWPFYFALFVWGLYGTFFAVPNTVIEPVMGHPIYNAWVWLCVAGTSFVMVGMLLPGTARFFGLWMQLGGHVCMGLVLLAYEVSAIVGTSWGRGSFAIFAIAPYVLGCVFLAVQAARKLRRVEHLQRVLGDA